MTTRANSNSVPTTWVAMATTSASNTRKAMAKARTGTPCSATSGLIDANNSGRAMMTIATTSTTVIAPNTIS